MTLEGAIGYCRALFRADGTRAEELPKDARSSCYLCRAARLRHAAFVTARAERLSAEGKTEEAAREIEFVRGVLWALGRLALQELPTPNETVIHRETTESR